MAVSVAKRHKAGMVTKFRQQALCHELVTIIMPIGIAYPVHGGLSFLYLIPNMSYNNVHVHVHVHVLLPYTCTCTTHVNEIEGICVWAFLKNANNYVNNVCLFLAQHNCDGASLGLCWLTARCPAQTPPLQ